MLFGFNANDQTDYNDEYDDMYVSVKVRVSVTRKGYNPNGKDKKKAELARKRARNAKYARRAR